MTRSLFSACFAGALCAALPTTATAATARAGNVVMGTVLQVTVVADDSSRANALAWYALDIARHWDDVLTTWRAEGELALLNATAGKGRQRVTGDLFYALTTMSRLSSATSGAFDPGVGPLVAKYSRSDDTSPMPSGATRIRDALEIGDGTAELSKGAALDAGGIGKGIALDAIAKELRAAGATGAYLDFGGSSQLAFGTSETGAPWTLALAGLAPGVSHGLLQLDGALSTSRSRPMGDPAGPIVDPRTSRVVAEPRFATCYAASATEAEVCSTALVVLGWGGYEPQRLPGWEALYEDGNELHVSPRFASMISVGPEKRASK